ncbi:MAG: SUMF1/EgtB/PvdO family nonheme iron enzyme [Planctomycetes bacterium]|nr:SUMF1/EgtB/PvdO family nonheme iron enzyme [Planctomycetota bacterium]
MTEAPRHSRAHGDPAHDPERARERDPARTSDAPGERFGRYLVLRRLGAGASGVVDLARQDGSGQLVALKRLRADLSDAAARRRFAREAAALGRLQHPGIARILEAGLGPDGRPYLALEHVDGQPLDTWARAHALSTRDVVALLARVADALDHAHRRGVVHRDLQPAHVLVDVAGRPRVLDFGLARLLDDDATETRLTRDDALLGTLGWLSPEQATGRRDVDERADVHALGLLAFALLAGRQAFEPGGRPLAEVLDEVATREPPRLGSLDPRLRGDLETIVAKALEKDPARRYPTAGAFAADLRRHLRDEPVLARPPSLRVQLVKLARRRRKTLAGAGVVLVALLLGTAAAAAGRLRAQAATRALTEESDEILRLSDARRLGALRDEADALWPAWPERADTMQQWIVRASALAGELPRHRATLERWRTEQMPHEDDASDLARRWKLSRLEELVTALDDFVHPASDDELGSLPEMERRVQRARDAARVSIDAHRAVWDEAVASIADRAASPLYDGLRLAPQVDLVPLGKDPGSGLWEFAHLPSGALPVRDAKSGRLALDADSAIVLVLVPGGQALMGAQADDPHASRFDPEAGIGERPVHAVELAPYFLGKHELTQAQYARLTGGNPSGWGVGWTNGVEVVTALHPVESLSWTEARAALARWGLVLPTEARWEHAARAGSDTPFAMGRDAASLAGSANLFDRTAARSRRDWEGRVETLPFDDGHLLHAPVGSFRPDAFGLHDMFGNVEELLADPYLPYDHAVREGDGFRLVRPGEEGAPPGVRGRSHAQMPGRARAAERANVPPDARSVNLGLRVARDVLPG